MSGGEAFAGSGARVNSGDDGAPLLPEDLSVSVDESAGAAPAMLQADWTAATEYGRFVRSYLETAKRPPITRVPS